MTNPARGPVHRLAQAPDDRMLDAGGLVTLDDLRQRYKLKTLKATTIHDFSSPMISSDEDFYPIIETIVQVPQTWKRACQQ